tara:strand:- start:266 stop:580 length:315 start_codon:yes stop_codon:yes gene_type:complete
MTLDDITRACKAARDKITGLSEKAPIVSYRLSVCLECPRRRKAKSLGEKASVVLGGEFDNKDVCGVCSCSIVLLTSATKENLHQDTPDQSKQRPDECWLTDIIL